MEEELTKDNNNENFALRCDIHKWISLSKQEMSIVNHPLFQRLRHIKQLTCVDQVYPTATHNRFVHSLGVMHVAGLYAKRLFKRHPRKKEMVQLARIAGLLHDIAHGPFSHSFDYTVYKTIYGESNQDNGHDLHRMRLIKETSLALLIVACGVDLSHLTTVWNTKTSADSSLSSLKPIDYDLMVVSALLHGPLGADRIDFTIRDAFHTGMTHFSSISVERLIHNSFYDFTSNPPVFGYNFKSIQDITHALESRFAMYNTVYLHRTSVSASVIIEKMLMFAIKHLRLVERTVDLDQFVYLTDNVYFEVLTNNDDDPDIVSAQFYAKRLYARRLLKMVSEEQIFDLTTPYTIGITSSTKDPNVFIHCSRVLKGVDAKEFDKFGIRIKQKDNTIVTLDHALQSIKYKGHQAPFYYKRIYTLNEKVVVVVEE